MRTHEAVLPAEELPERVAAAGLLVPVLLMMVLSALRSSDASSGPIALSNGALVAGFLVELALSLTLGAWLWRRGWRPLRTATRRFEGRDLPRGMLLWTGGIVTVALWAVVCRWLFPDVFQVAQHTELVGAPHFAVSLGFSLFNAVFEELLWLGLGFAAFRRLGVAAAGGISAALRVLAHAYQGPLALVTVLPISVVFTVYYIRTQRMWPVVVAHAFQDTLALGLLAGSHSSSGLPNMS